MWCFDGANGNGVRAWIRCEGLCTKPVPHSLWNTSAIFLMASRFNDKHVYKDFYSSYAKSVLTINSWYVGLNWSTCRSSVGVSVIEAHDYLGTGILYSIFAPVCGNGSDNLWWMVSSVSLLTVHNSLCWETDVTGAFLTWKAPSSV